MCSRCVARVCRARSAGSVAQGAPRWVRSVLGTHSACTHVEQVCVAPGCPAGGWRGAATPPTKSCSACSSCRNCSRCRRSAFPPALCPVWVNLNTVVARGGLRAALCPPSTDPAPFHHPPLLAASSPAQCSCMQGRAHAVPIVSFHPPLVPAVCWCLTPRPQTGTRPLWVQAEGKHSSSRAARYARESSSGGSDITGGYSGPCL